MAAPAERISWFDLELEHKEKLFQRTGLICGVYADGSRSGLPVLDIKKAEPLFHGLDLFNAESKAETVRSKREFSMLQKGWTQSSAEMSSPWISASVKYREEEQRGHTSKEEYIYTTATYRMPTYQVQITKEEAASALSSQFLDAVEKAVALENPFEPLQKVFENYGYILQLKVELGASITMSAMQKNTGKTDEASSKRTLETEVSGKYGAFAAGVSFGKGNEEETKEMIENQVGSIKIEVNGGDKKLLTDTKGWLATTEDIKRMTVIWTSDVITITDLIESSSKDLYDKIQKAYGQPLIGRWVPVKQARDGLPDDLTLHVGFPDNDWPKNGWCHIGHCLGSNCVLLVKDAPGHSGGLGTCTFKGEDALRIQYSSDEDRPEYELVIRQAVPDSEGYTSIGAIVRRPTGYSFLDGSGGNPDNFRAIRKDLLSDATFAFETTAILASERRYGPFPVGWKIIPKDPNEGIDTGFFWPDADDGNRDIMLKKNYPLYLLKKSAIKIDNTPEEALAGK